MRWVSFIELMGIFVECNIIFVYLWVECVKRRVKWRHARNIFL